MLRGIEKWLSVLQNKAWEHIVSAKSENNIRCEKGRNLYRRNNFLPLYIIIFDTKWGFSYEQKCILSVLTSWGTIFNKTNSRGTSYFWKSGRHISTLNKCCPIYCWACLSAGIHSIYSVQNTTACLQCNRYDCKGFTRNTALKILNSYEKYWNEKENQGRCSQGLDNSEINAVSHCFQWTMYHLSPKGLL